MHENVSRNLTFKTKCNILIYIYITILSTLRPRGNQQIDCNIFFHAYSLPYRDTKFEETKTPAAPDPKHNIQSLEHI